MNSARHSLPGAVVALLVMLSLPAWAWADDVTTLSGATFHEVRLVRVEPDGVTWEHSTGMVKVDFTDLPEAVRRTYHYDAGQAAAFREAQAQARQQFDARARQAQREAEARQVQRFQSPGAAAGSEARPGEFVYRHRAGEAAAEKSLGEVLATKEAAEDFRTKDDGTMWDRRLWAVPKLIFGGNAFDGVSFDPKTDFNSHEYQSSLHHGVVGDAKGSANDAFFQPIYMTKSYYDDLDRAAAFARGKP